MAQQRLTVTLETITPLFLGGANQQPELRPTAFRGALRFWLRALLGGEIGDNFKLVNDVESKVFGDTSGASPVVVRIDYMQFPEYASYRPLLHNPRRTFKFDGFKPKQKFVLKLSSRLGSQFDLQDLTPCLLLFLLLGGLGRRSRRGFGTLKAENIISHDKNGIQEIIGPNYTDIESFASAARDIFKRRSKITSILDHKPVKSSTSTPKFPIFDNDHTKVLLCKQPFKRWEDAMTQFWGKLRSSPYRNDRVFGKESPRQASPLHLRVIQVGDSDAYYLLMTAFRTRFKQGRPNWKRLEDFLKDCQSSWSGTFLHGGHTSW